MKNQCEVESCENEGYVYNAMDNILCEHHFEQDMEETGDIPEYYTIIENDH